MDTLWHDIRYAVRTLLKSPGYTALAVVALALGIGANTAVFSVADAFLLKPLPHLEHPRLVMVMERRAGSDWNDVAPANYFDWKEQSASFERWAALEWFHVNLTGEGSPEKLQGFLATVNLFETLDVKPQLGRTFLPEEEEPGRDQVVVLSHGLWERRFGSDPAILGKTVKLEGKACTVVGVMPKGFEFPLTAELWLPLAMDAKEKAVRGNHYLEVVARLKPGVSITQAQAELNTITRRLQETYPDTNKGWGVWVMTVREFASGNLTRQYTLLLMGAVGFVLLIACANVANLQFARATSRQKEIAVRVAVGAGRWRVVRQLLTESVVLALAGCGLGLLLGLWGIELILAYMPPEVAKFIVGWKEIQFDYRAFLFSVGAAVLAGLISGLVPALQASRPDLNETLKEGGRSTTAGRSRHRMRSLFVIAEVSLSLVLLVGAGLMVKGVRALIHVNRDFEPETLLTFRVNLPEAKYKEPHQREAFYEQALGKLETIPGVEAAAVVTSPPFSNSYSISMVSIEGHPTTQAGEMRLAQFQTVSTGYFRLMHIPLRDGRGFTEGDGADTPRVAIIGEGLARRYWPGESPLGKRVKVGAADAPNPWLTVVGVVADVRYQWIDRDIVPAFYRPYRQAPRSVSDMVVRTAGDPMQFASAVRSAIADVDPDMPIFNLKREDTLIYQSILGLSYVAVMLTVLGVIALVLSSVGVYGVMAYSVTERTHEIGVRMALGAQARDVLRLVLGRGFLLTAVGMSIGLALAVGLAQLLAGLIFGVSASDLTTFLGVSLMLTVVALVACYVPARRATRVDPMVALRYE